MNLFNELKRRNVIRVATAYLVVGWLLIQILGIATDSFEAPAWVMKLAITLIVIGFFISLIISWVYELTPEGIKKEKDINSDDSITQETSNKLNYITIVAAFAVAGMIVWQQFGDNRLDSRLRENDTANSINPAKAEIPPKEQEIQPNSIAVLPFTDLSPNKDQEYFSDGMAEEILNVLVRVDALKVTSRTSAFQFKGQEIGIPEIAKQLKVRHVLEGSVRKSGDTLRITAQLIDAQNDKHLWSKTYDRPLTTDNIFAIQDEISNAIVQSLSDELGLNGLEKVNVRASTTNISAYEQYLKAKPLFLARSDLDVADNYLIQALELDPKFAKAWEMRAALQSLMTEYGYSDMKIDEVESLTEKFAYKSIEIEPKSALAKAVLAKQRMVSSDTLRNQYNVAQTIKLYDEAIEIDPNTASTYNWRGLYYMTVGHIDKASKDYQTCLDLEPYYEPCFGNIVQAVEVSGDVDRALTLLREGLNEDKIYLDSGDLNWLARSKQEIAFKFLANRKGVLDGWRRVDYIYQAYLHPNQDHSQLVNDLLTFAKKNTTLSEVKLGNILIPLGAHNIMPDGFLMWSAGYRKYRQSQEFKHYIIESGIYDYWREVSFPPQCRPLGEDDFECD
jgi:TolB-like protein/Tfp pilus assembly protein PilF